VASDARIWVTWRCRWQGAEKAWAGAAAGLFGVRSFGARTPAKVLAANAGRVSVAARCSMARAAAAMHARQGRTRPRGRPRQGRARAGLTPIADVGAKTLGPRREAGRPDAVVFQRQLSAVIQHAGHCISQTSSPTRAAYGPSGNGRYRIARAGAGGARRCCARKAERPRTGATAGGKEDLVRRQRQGARTTPLSRFAQPDIDGGLIGGEASLKAADFAAILGRGSGLN